MRASLRLFVPFLLVLPASHAASQSLLLLTDGAATAGASRLHELPFGCGPSLASCPVQAGTLPLQPIPLGLGGLGYFRGQARVADGGFVNEVSLPPACNPLGGCALAGFGPVTDIGIDDTPFNAWLVATDGLSVARMPIGCPGSPPLSRCAVPGMPNPIAIDWDRRTGNYWVCDTTGLIAEVQFTSAFSCVTLRVFGVACAPPQVPVLPIQALAAHACSQQLFLADAIGNVITMTMNGFAVSCCRPASLGPGELIVGLAVRPAQPRVLAAGCSTAPCPPCAPLFTAASDSVLPNPSYRLDLSFAPFTVPASTAALFLSFTPGPTPLPGVFCTPLELAGQILTVAQTPTVPGAGLAPCHGTAFAFLNLPNVQAMCGWQLYMQWVVLCGGPNPALSMSNGLAITLD